MLADALTSVLAIVACWRRGSYGWTWADPAIGVVGALVIAHWSWGLIRDSGAVLLDAAPNRAGRGDPREARSRPRPHRRPACLAAGPGHHAAIVSLVADEPEPVEHYKARLSDLPQLSHVTVEVHRCNRVNTEGRTETMSRARHTALFATLSGALPTPQAGAQA